MSKKLVLLMMVLMLLVTGVSSALAADTTESALEQFNRLTGNSYTSNYRLTREDFCVAIAKVFMTGNSKTAKLPFADADQVKPDSVSYLSVLYANKILSGNAANGKLYMYPNANITRQESITLLGKILSKTSEYNLTFGDKGSIPEWAYGYVAWFAENGIIVGDGVNLRPADTMTAGELAVMTMKTVAHKQLNSVNVTTVFGTGTHGLTNGGIKEARFSLPYGIAFDKYDDIIVFDTYNNAIRKISSDKVETVTGSIKGYDTSGFPKGYYLDDATSKALLNRPSDGVYNSKGELIFADSENNVIRFIRNGSVYTFSGTTEGYRDGANNSAQFNCPMAIAIDKDDNIYVADTLNNCIRKVDASGKVTTVAGTPGKEGMIDGASSSARFRAPAGIAVEPDGSVIYVADTGNHCIRKIEKGVVSTIAGTAANTDEDGYPLGGFANGAAGKAMFNLPRGLTMADGTLIIADSGNDMIRAITKAGTVVSVAGIGEPGDKDGGALDAGLNNPCGVCYHKDVLYIADTGNNKIKKMAFKASLYE